MVVVVPLWFYEFGSVMYILAAVTCMLLAYFSLKLYRYMPSNKHMMLYSGFVAITLSFIILAMGNIQSFINFDECQPNCKIDPTEPSYSWIRIGNYGYYLMSLIGYALIGASYVNLKQKGKRIVFLPATTLILTQPTQIFVMYPFVNSFFHIFHILAFAILIYIVSRTATNYSKTKSELSLMVTAGFISISMYHMLMLTIPYIPAFFALAHFFLLAGLLSLLAMLMRVNKK